MAARPRALRRCLAQGSSSSISSSSSSSRTRITPRLGFSPSPVPRRPFSGSQLARGTPSPSPGHLLYWASIGAVFVAPFLYQIRPAVMLVITSDSSSTLREKRNIAARSGFSSITTSMNWPLPGAGPSTRMTSSPLSSIT